MRLQCCDFDIWITSNCILNSSSPFNQHTCYKFWSSSFTEYAAVTSPLTQTSYTKRLEVLGIYSLEIRRITAPLSPVLIGGICVPPTVNCLQYLVTGSTLTAVGPFQLPVPQSGTHSRISSGSRPSVRTVSDGCLKLICSLDTSAFSALEVLTTTALYKRTYLLTFTYFCPQRNNTKATNSRASQYISKH